MSLVAARSSCVSARSTVADARAGRSRQSSRRSDDPDDPVERLDFHLSRVPIGVLALNSRAEIVDCNATAMNLLGVTRDQLIGRVWTDFGGDVVYEDGTPVNADTGPIAQALRERRMVGGAIMGVPRPRRGDRVWLELHVHPRLKVTGDVREVILMFRDIAERRLRQAAERQRDQAERRAAEAERRHRRDAERQLRLERLTHALPGESPATVRLRNEILEAAQTVEDLPVLITGEPGTGKTLVARTLHEVSSRRGGPFESVDCSSISPSLFESEVFGHERGAFTGASGSRAGRFEMAHGGTLFLDEVGDFPLDQQPKLLVALQERRVRRLGAKADTAVKIAIVAATNHDLKRMVAEGRFRADLFDRLNGVTIGVPPLRDRREDLGVLVDRFVRAAEERRGTTIRDIDPEVFALLERFDWPGNVRQLYQVVHRMVARAKGDRLTADLVPDEIRAPRAVPGRGERPAISKALLEEVLAATDGNVRRTAERLGTSRASLYRLMDKHGITPPR